MPQAFELNYVIDESTDATNGIIHALRARDSRVAPVNPSRVRQGGRPGPPARTMQTAMP